MPKKIIIAGAGFTGISLAAYLAKNGFEVEIYEKNESPGGKVRRFIHDGFAFDMGPSVYLYPEIFERFFNAFNHTASDFYTLKKLNPSCRVFFKPEDYFDIPAEYSKLLEMFDQLEPDGGEKLSRYLRMAEKYYERFRDPTQTHSFLEYKKHFKYPMLNSFLDKRKHHRVTRSLFSSLAIISMLEFPLPFLGIMPACSPALSFATNFSLLKSGVFYPKGGMHRVEAALTTILGELNVPIYVSSEVNNFDIIGDAVRGILTHQKNFHADLFASAMDYYHTEQLIGKEFRNYPGALWKSSTKHPSILIYYLGFGTRLKNLQHHNLVFNDCFELPYRKAIKFNSKYKTCLSFITCTSKTDTGNAPEGTENLVARVSIPPGLEDTGKMREHYLLMLLNRLEAITGQKLVNELIVKKSFAMNDFKNEYHSYNGQAFGSLNYVRPMMFRIPKIRNRHLSNLYYGDLPSRLGPGMAAALLNGEMVANTIIHDWDREHSFKGSNVMA